MIRVKAGRNFVAVLLLVCALRPASAWAQVADALIEVTPSGGLNASTFNAGSFIVTNNSTGGRTISRVKINTVSSIFPDIVFDPAGVAGDTTAKCLTADTGATTTGFVAPANACTNPFSSPHDLGFDEIEMTFTHFAPGEVFTFSVDVDPTSIRGTSGGGAASAGSVSGVEMSGALVTVEFDGGEIITGRLFRAGTSSGKGQIRIKAGAPPAPGIEALNVASTPAVVSNASQTIRVTGAASTGIRLLQLEGDLDLNGGAGFDLDPFEANRALVVSEYAATIGAGGIVDVPVTLTRASTSAGRNYFLGVANDADGSGRTGTTSQVVVLQLGSNCAQNSDCADGNACTSDLCDTVQGCSNPAIPNGGACNDGIACTASDQCSAGVCAGVDNCPGSQVCNPSTGICETPSGDDDHDGLAGAADPCPFDPRNLCVGPVAIDLTSGKQMRLNTNVSNAECSGTKTDCNGDVWQGDFGYNQSQKANTCTLGGGGEGCVISGIVEIFGCEDESTEDIFQCDHSDRPPSPELQYSFNVADSRYLVNLFFANTYTGTTQPGQRIFDVSIEGALVLDNFDQVVVGGGSGVAVVRSFDVTVADGNGLQILFGHVVENPAIKAIEVLRFACSVNADCNDLNPCTNDACNAGQCQYSFNTSSCNDGVACTSGDVCASGTCAGTSNCPLGQTCNLATGLCGAPSVSFGKGFLAGATLTNPTSLQFGPDDRLYVAQQDGLIKAFNVLRTAPNEYSATGTELIDLIRSLPNRNDNGALNPSVTERLITGLYVGGTAANPTIWALSSDPRIGGGSNATDKNLDTNSGILSRLRWTGSAWQKVDLVRGLPRSEENHSGNGIIVDETAGLAYLAYGGHTNMGAPSNNFVFLTEYAYSAAILQIDLAAIGDTTLDLPTLDDEDQAGNPDASDPFGGNNGKNQARIVPGSPVQIYAPGFRNPFDLVITEAGRMYSIDNGSNAAWGDIPIGNGTASCTNGISEPGTSQNDSLHFVTGPGYYGGHPNPTRANPANTFNASNPQSPVTSGNAIECSQLAPGPANDALVTFPQSTNGLAEYTANNFGGQMNGDLLAAGWNNVIWRLQLNAAGTAVTASNVLFSNVGEKPLDVIALDDDDLFPGSIWVADHKSGQIVIYEPSDAFLCSGDDDPGLDEDSDGYSNADEIDNNTDPCSAGDFPEDSDSDSLSNLNDPDDDNDGIVDTVDPFARDPENGTQTILPFFYDWENNGPQLGGILELGFTGLMTNGTSNYEALFDTEKMTAGGAAGVTTVDEVSEGDALAANDSQEYGFQTGIDAQWAGGLFTVHTRIVGPFLGSTPEDFQSMGLFIGNGDQDNYVKVVTSSNGGIGGVETVKEIAGVVTAPAPVLEPMPGPDVIDLYLTVDPVGSSVQAAYSVTNGGVIGPIVPVGGEQAIPSAWLNDPSFGLAVGLISTSRGPALTFAATWDFIEVRAGPTLCATNAECDDAIACTTDSCVAGNCLNDPISDGGTCNDGIACTTGDICTGGICGGVENCPPNQFCNTATGLCEVPSGDPDDDGLSGVTDPCPFDPRNFCFGPVAVDAGTGTAIRLNANVSAAECSGTRVDCAGDTWFADFGFNQAHEATTCNLNGGGEGCAIAGIDELFGCFDESTEDIFQCGHADTVDPPELSYAFNVPDGEYLVNLFFANTSTATIDAGSRVFDVLIEGAIAYDNFDQVVAAGGSAIAVVRSAVATVSDGNGLQIEFGHVTGDPAIKAIEVLAVPAPTTTTTTTTTMPPTTTTTLPPAAPIALDATSLRSACGGAEADTISIPNVPVGNQPNRILIVTVGAEEDNGDCNLGLASATATYGGTLLTKATTAVSNTSSWRACNGIFYMLNPPAGTANVVITFPATTGTPIDNRHAGAFVLYNAAQQAPEATKTAGANATTDPVNTSITTLTDGSWVVDVMTQGNLGTFVTTQAGQTEVWEQGCVSSVSATSAKPVPTAGATLLGWDSSSPKRYAHALAAFAPAAVVTTTSTTTTTLFPPTTTTLPPSAEITLDATSLRSACGGAEADTITIPSVPVGNQPSRILLVTVGAEEDNGDCNLGLASATATYGGTLLTKAVTAVSNTSSWRACNGIFYMLNPPAGTANVVITFPATTGTPIDNRHAGAFVLYNAAQQAPEATNIAGANATTDPVNTSITPLTDGSWVVDVMTQGNLGTFVTTQAGQTEVWEQGCVSSVSATSVKPVLTAGATLLGWDSSSPKRYAHALAAFAPGAVATTTTTLPPVTTTQPPVTTTQPPVTTTQPPVTTTQPPVTTTQPPVTTTQPPVTTTQPPVTTTQPPVTTTQPPVTTTQRPVTTTQLPGTTTLPPTTTVPPPTTTTLPPDCVVNADCADADPCTTDLCVAGECQNDATPEGGACNDGVACTAGDICTAGECAGTDNCPLFQSCNLTTGVCGTVAGDPDKDGLAGAADPCPLDPRNACFGPVATHATNGLPIRINANVSSAECSGTKVDCAGDTWFADFGYSASANSFICDLGGGGEGCVINGITALFGCDNETTEDIFQCEHYDRPALPELSYTFAVPNGQYVVNLFFANTYTGTATVGSRVFDISIEGTLVYDNFDQIVAAGASGTAVVRSALVNVSDGNGLTILFGHVTENPAVKAIEVLAASAGSGFAASLPSSTVFPSTSSTSTTTPKR